MKLLLPDPPRDRLLDVINELRDARGGLADLALVCLREEVEERAGAHLPGSDLLLRERVLLRRNLLSR